MGLDIYFYTIKDKDKYRKYQAARRKYDALYDEMYKKYKEPYDAACKKWQNLRKKQQQAITIKSTTSILTKYQELNLQIL